MKRIEVTLTRSGAMRHVPLAALGYGLRQAEVLRGLGQVSVPAKSVEHTHEDKLMEARVLILAGGRATNQVDLLLRPNTDLARAWGQQHCAQQATLARMLDAMDGHSIESLRAVFDELCETGSDTVQHDFRRGELWLDGDLSGLRASRRAEGSERGYFAGEKTQAVVRWRGCATCTTTRRCTAGGMPVRPTACTHSNPSSNTLSAC